MNKLLLGISLLCASNILFATNKHLAVKVNKSAAVSFKSLKLKQALLSSVSRLIRREKREKKYIQNKMEKLLKIGSFPLCKFLNCDYWTTLELKKSRNLLFKEMVLSSFEFRKMVYLWKVSENIFERPMKIKDNEPLIIIAVPGLGQFGYDSADYHRINLKEPFPSVCSLNETDYSDNFISKDPIIVSGTPYGSSALRILSGMPIMGSRVDPDYQEFLTERELDNNESTKKLYNKLCYPNKLPPDLGQKNCQKCFMETVEAQLAERKEEFFRVIFHGFSQGTATLVNYIAQLVKDGKYDEKTKSFSIAGKNIIIEAIVLDSVVATGTSVFAHQVPSFFSNSIFNEVYSFFMGMNPFQQFAHYTKLLGFLGHDFRKELPIDSITKIPKDIPLLIVHGKNDSTTPFSGAKALYYARTRIAGCNNAYFLQFDVANHGGFFRKSQMPYLQYFDGSLQPEEVIICDAYKNNKEEIIPAKTVLSAKMSFLTKFNACIEDKGLQQLESAPLKKVSTNTGFILEHFPPIYKAIKGHWIDSNSKEKLVENNAYIALSELYNKCFQPSQEDFGQKEHEQLKRTRCNVSFFKVAITTFTAVLSIQIITKCKTRMMDANQHLM